MARTSFNIIWQSRAKKRLPDTSLAPTYSRMSPAQVTADYSASSCERDRLNSTACRSIGSAVSQRHWKTRVRLLCHICSAENALVQVGLIAAWGPVGVDRVRTLLGAFLSGRGRGRAGGLRVLFKHCRVGNPWRHHCGPANSHDSRIVEAGNSRSSHPPGAAQARCMQSSGSPSVSSVQGTHRCKRQIDDVEGSQSGHDCRDEEV